jgi:death on curing protein
VGEVVELHRRLLQETGGAHGIREFGALESAIAQPKATFGGINLHHTLVEKAAALGFSLMEARRLEEGIHRPDRAVEPIVLKVLGEQFGETMVFGIGPEVRIEPPELVRRRTPERGPEQSLGRVEDLELHEDLLCLTARVLRRQERHTGRRRTRHRGHELNQRLVRHSNGILGDAPAQQLRSDPLLGRKPGVEAIHQYVGVNEGGRARRDPPGSSRGHPRAPAGGCARALAGAP